MPAFYMYDIFSSTKRFFQFPWCKIYKASVTDELDETWTPTFERIFWPLKLKIWCLNLNYYHWMII